MVGEIATFVAKHKAKLFPSGESKKTPVSKRPGSVGELGKPLEQNDPETLKFVKRHDTAIHGEKPEVATKYALDNPINSHMKPEEGVYEDMEEAKGKCSKCGVTDCSCRHEECGGKKLISSKKLKEETLSNAIAMEFLEGLKAIRLDEQEIATRKQAKAVADKAYDASRPTKRSFVDKVMGRSESPEAHVKSYHRDIGRNAVKKFYDLKSEGVSGEVHKVNPDNPDFTGGMHVHTKPKAEVATGHKPAVAATEKSKKLSKKEMKEAHHHEPMPKLDNPSHGSGCTGHEDTMPAIKKPHADPTKIPNRNKVPNSTQPKVGVLDKKKVTEDIVSDILDEGLFSALGKAENWVNTRKAPSFKAPKWAEKYAGRWNPESQKGPATAAPKGKSKGPKTPVAPAKREVSGGTGGSIEGALSANRGKWTEGGKKKNK